MYLPVIYTNGHLCSTGDNEDLRSCTPTLICYQMGMPLLTIVDKTHHIKHICPCPRALIRIRVSVCACPCPHILVPLLGRIQGGGPGVQGPPLVPREGVLDPSSKMKKIAFFICFIYYPAIMPQNSSQGTKSQNFLGGPQTPSYMPLSACPYPYSRVRVRVSVSAYPCPFVSVLVR